MYFMISLLQDLTLMMNGIIMRRPEVEDIRKPSKDSPPSTSTSRQAPITKETSAESILKY